MTARCSGVAVYPNTVVGGATQSSASCTVDRCSAGSRTRSPVGTQVHSEYSASAWPRRAVAADTPVNAIPAELAFNTTIPAVDDDSMSRDDTRSSDLLSGGGVVDACSRSARQDSDDDTTAELPPPTKLTTAVSTGNSLGKIGRAHV